jgi:hypothetical protein
MIRLWSAWLTASSSWRLAGKHVPGTGHGGGCHSQTGQVPVRAVGRGCCAVSVFGRIWAPWSFLCTRVHKILQQA